MQVSRKVRIPRSRHHGHRNSSGRVGMRQMPILLVPRHVCVRRSGRGRRNRSLPGSWRRHRLTGNGRRPCRFGRYRRGRRRGFRRRRHGRTGFRRRETQTRFCPLRSCRRVDLGRRPRSRRGRRRDGRWTLGPETRFEAQRRGLLVHGPDKLRINSKNRNPKDPLAVRPGV